MNKYVMNLIIILLMVLTVIDNSLNHNTKAIAYILLLMVLIAVNKGDVN